MERSCRASRGRSWYCCTVASCCSGMLCADSVALPVKSTACLDVAERAKQTGQHLTTDILG